MKRKWTIVVIVLLTVNMIGSLLWLTDGTTQIKKLLPFDPETMGVVDVIVVDLHRADDTPHYYHIGADRIKREAEPFEPEDMTVTHIFPACLDGLPRKDGNKAYYQLGPIQVFDEEGRKTENTDPLLEKVLRQMENQEYHDVMVLRLLQTGGEAFLYTELNVNWWCPCELYWYDRQNDRLVELYTFDGLEVAGMRIRDLERAK